MGTFSRTIILTGPSGASASFEGMIDTGAHFTVVPAAALRELGVRPIDRIAVQFANGETADWGIGEVTATLEGLTRPILVLFGADDGTVLIGAHTLEALLLDIDGIEKKLVHKRALLM